MKGGRDGRNGEGRREEEVRGEEMNTATSQRIAFNRERWGGRRREGGWGKEKEGSKGGRRRGNGERKGRRE